MEINSSKIINTTSSTYDFITANPIIAGSMTIGAITLGGIGLMGGAIMGSTINSPYDIGIIIGTSGAVTGAIIGLTIGLAGSVIYNNFDEICL